MFSRLPRQYLFGAAIAFLLSASLLNAQSSFGSVIGNVTDPSGAAIAATTVTLTNLGTNEKRTESTNAEGLYQFVNVIPGQYSVEGSKTGFKRVLQANIIVETQTTTKIDLNLQVGEVSQTVEVTAQTPLLQPETSSLGAVVDERKATELPLNGRNPLNLVALVPSVVPQGGSLSNPNGQNPFAWGNYQIGGGQANQSAVWLDGSPVNGSYINITALIPTQDSLQEFKVATNNLSPEYGRFAGGVVNFTTKSGTNDLHGTAWEFLRNRDLDANDFFSNRSGVPRGAFTQNQFGFNLGGPIEVPKLYHGRNKTFFFVDYEGFRLRQGESFSETVPTAAERTGDLSGLGLNIYDPTTTCGIQGLPACPAGQTGTRAQFPGNVIPTNRLNPASLKMLSLYPLPNNLGGANGVGNYVANASVGGNNNETVVHIDQNVSDKQHISARYSYWGNLNLPIDPLGTGVCQDRCAETFNTNNFVLSDTYSFTPTTILEIRGSYQRFSYDRTPETLGYDLTSLGWPAAYNTEAVFRDLPVPVINGFDTANTFGSQGAGSVIVDRNDNYRAAGTLTKIAGNHTLRFGGEAVRMTHNYGQTNIPSGIFYFDQNFTASSPAVSGATPTGGAGLASFLLGYPTATGSTSEATSPALVAAQQYYGAVFANDDWHVTPRLTVNLGLRWEHSGPWTERYNRLTYFNPTAANSVVPGYTGDLELVDTPAYGNRSNILPNWKQFAPRVGLAYQITPKTVFRGGYGIFWLPNDVAWDYSPNNNPVNNYSTTYAASANNGLTPVTLPGSTVSPFASNPFPSGIIAPPQRNADYASVLLGQSINVPQTSNPYGYAQQWNAGIQREFGQGLLLDVAYGAAKGTHLPIESPQIDQLPDQYLSLGNALNNSVPNPFYGKVLSGTLSLPTVAYGQLLRPYPEYNGVNYSGQGIGNSSYQSLQVQATKRFGGGNSISVAYTFSKLIADTDTVTNWLENGGGTTFQDWNNIQGERSLSSFDTPHRLVISYVLDIPVGKGRKYLANTNGLLQAAVGGWGVQGVTTIQSGFPLHFSTASNNTNSFGGGSRPNVDAGCDKSTSGSATDRLDDWFNQACFSQPAAFTFGDEPRTDPTLRSPGVANFDFAAVKSFPIHEKASVQFRAEFFNIFNRVQFSYPGQTFGNSDFGVISSQQNLPRLIQFALRLGF